MGIEIIGASLEPTPNTGSLKFEQIIEKYPLDKPLFSENIPHESYEEFVNNNFDLKEADSFAENAHKDQKRKDGSPYITHCRAVGKLIYDLGIRDHAMLMACLLHDTKEDTKVTLAEILAKFGKEVADLVEDASEFVPEEPMSKEEKDKQTLKKSFRGAFTRPKGALIKAAGDRMHNMLTLDAMPEENRVKKAKDTYAYTKLLESLGVWRVMERLEDLAFRYSEPQEFKNIQKIAESDFRTTDNFTGFWKSQLEKIVNESSLTADVEVRLSNLSHLKYKLELSDIKEVNDLTSFKIVIDNDDENQALLECYGMLGIIRQKFGHAEDTERFDDFYSFPQINGYSAIQVTLNNPNGAFEIIITSKAKEEYNNWGIVSLIRKGVTDLSSYSRIMVFTESNEVKFFPPEGASGLDFANSISESMLNQATDMLMDEKRVPITTPLENGSKVKINLGKSEIKPGISYLGMCLPSTQKTIDKLVLNHERQNLIGKGKEVVTKIIANRGLIDLIDLKNIEPHAGKLAEFLYTTGSKRSLSNLYYKAGKGSISEKTIKEKLNSSLITRKDLKLNTIYIEGDDTPGVLEFMGAKIREAKGNIGPESSKPEIVDGKKIFKARLVIEELEQEGIKKLEKALSLNPAITKVIIV